MADPDDRSGNAQRASARRITETTQDSGAASDEEVEQAAVRRVTERTLDLGSTADGETKQELLSVVTRSEFSGPLPSPEAFMGYREVLPEAPDRILRMAEKEQDIRQEAIRGAIRNDRSRINRSTIVSLAIVAVAGLAFFFGYPWAAVPLGLAGMLGALVRRLSDSLSR